MGKERIGLRWSLSGQREIDREVVCRPRNAFQPFTADIFVLGRGSRKIAFFWVWQKFSQLVFRSGRFGERALISDSAPIFAILPSLPECC